MNSHLLCICTVTFLVLVGYTTIYLCVTVLSRNPYSYFGATIQDLCNIILYNCVIVIGSLKWTDKYDGERQ